MWIAALLFACPAPETEVEELPTCPETSLAEGEVIVFATGLEDGGTKGTEGLVFSPDGRLFVGGASHGGGGFVAEVMGDGTHEIIAPAVASVGLEWWNGKIVVAVGADGPAGDVGGLVLVDPDSGETTVLANDIPSANFPVLTPWDTLLVSAPSGTSLWEVTADGTTTQWLTNIPSPNGLVFNDDGSSLYVAQTYETPNVFRRVDVSDGVAGQIHDVATLEDGSTQDGVAIDVAGNVYIVLNLPGQIVRVAPDGQVTLMAQGVEFGASLRFGTGDFDPCSLYVTSLFSDVLYEVGTGMVGAN